MPPQASEPIINRCPECEQEIDVSELSPFSKISCPHCDETIRVRTMLGAFHLTKLLGEGGMSQVFLAVDSTLNREVALKVLHRSLTKDAGLTAMFEREAKLTALINHSNVVRVFQVGEDQGFFFIAMELVDNVSLEEKISGQGQIRENETLEIAYDVSLGLRAAFQAGLIHRDIKPGNILLTRDGSAKLVDFGLALAHGGVDEVEEVWATPFYVPPEKLDGEPDDFRGDIYSLGATLFHAIAGHPPFEANTASMQDLKEIKAKPLHLKEAAPHASAKAAKLIDRMMAYKPAGRHQSYDELVEEIGSLLDEVSGGSGRGGRKVGDRRGSAALQKKLAVVGIPMLALGLGLAVYFGRSNGDNDELTSPLLEGGGERVLGDGDSTASQFNEARKALVEGRFSAAHEQFADLLATADLKQPTRSWTRFNTAVSLLFEGDEAGARPVLAELATDEGFPAKPDPTVLVRLFKRIGELGADPLPVMQDAAAEFGGDSVECVGLLICGLKNWNAREFESGADYLSRFVASTPPNNYTWISQYQSLVSAYLDDLEIIRDLPRPERMLEPAKLDAMQKQLTLAVAALKTKGAAPEFARGRLERAEQFLTTPAPNPPTTEVATANGNGKSNGSGGGTPPPIAMNPVANDPAVAVADPAVAVAEAAELKRVEKLAAELAAATQQYRFAEAAGQWKAESFESDSARNLAELEALACQRSEEFIGGMVVCLAKGDFNGIVQRRSGVPLDARITAAERDTVIIDLGFGPNQLAFSELDPAWLLATARDKVLAESGATAESDPALWSRAAWFARSAGLMDDARELAAEVAVFSEVFQKNWEFLEGAGDGSN